MIKLNPRLGLCASFVTRGGFVIDVGTDHGYLPCFLVENGLCSGALACDIAVGPLLAAKKHIEQLELEDRITAVLSDGLKALPERASAATDIVIAGMGGELIAKILDEGEEFPKSRRLVLQANTRVPVLRRYLYETGYEILSESAVQDGKFIYSVICAAYSGRKRSPTELELELGGLSADEPLAREYLKRQSERFRSAAVGMTKSESSEKQALADRSIALAEGIDEFLGRR